MPNSDYIPLHLHSEYSLLDGAIRLSELVDTAAGYGMPAVAVTDHGNLFGAVEFYIKAKKAGVKPIIGCEVYVAPKSRHDRSKAENEHSFYHLLLLAKDNEGYRNLVNLVSKAYTEGFYYKPRIDRELMEQYNKGLVCLTACLKGEVPNYLARGDAEKARKTASFLREVFGPENFYIEIQENGLPEQVEVNKKLVALARELQVGLAATNDCHYLRREDARAHDILLCIQTGKNVNDKDRLKFDSDGFYFKSPDEMREAFKDLPEAVLNTRAIAEMCGVEFKLGENLLPEYKTPEGTTPAGFLEDLVLKGMKGKFGENPPAEYMARLNTELSVIKKMDYSSYFLIVYDFINHSKENGIPVGPGRGSAAGSLVAYSLGITEIDPIRYGLLFERFLNPDRISMPDIDVDFCKDRRGDVINYVSEKYGKDHVAQIITFGTMAARGAIRDVARALDFPYSEADRLAKLVPEDPKIHLADAIAQEPQLREAGENDPRVGELLTIAKRLEGLARHASTHAAGMVISPKPLTDLTPLYRNPADGSITTQFDMSSAEKMGLIKFDLLGLKTLTIIRKAIDYIAEASAEGGTTAGGGNTSGLSIGDIPLDDKATYDLLGSGQTTGIFQLESAGMRDILVKMLPNRFEDLIALVALYRPGPIGSGMIDDFIKVKRGKVAVKYELPQLKDVLDETYGVILYQEQVMNIANKLAGFTMGQADVLRKAMGKKKPEEMEKQREAFMSGSAANGIPEKKAVKIFELMAKFAEYGFNKSHSAAYALVAYQTAYLKAHYPVEFMAATLSADIDSTDKIVKSINECANMSIEILPPDINLCGREFKVTGKSIRFGLGAVKGAGTAAIEAILSVREDGKFSSFEEFLKRVDGKKVNKKVMESLIKAGAFDSLSLSGGKEAAPQAKPPIGQWRAKLMGMLGNSPAPSLSLFGQAESGQEEEGWDESLLLRYEKEAIGFYITGNPLTKYRRQLAILNVRPIASLDDAEDKIEISTAGMVSAIKKMKTKSKGETMAAVTLEDEGGTCEVIVFPELYNSNAELLKKDFPVMVKGTLDRTEKGLKVIAKELTGLEGAFTEGGNGKKVEINITIGGSVTPALNNGSGIKALRELKMLVADSVGPMPLYLRMRVDGIETLIQTSSSVRPSGPLIEGVERNFGKGAIRIN